MVEKVSVIYLVEISLGQQEAHMLLQLFTVPERIDKTFHDKLLFCRQPVRVLRVHGGEMAVQHLIYRAIQTDAASPIIHQMKQVPAFQLEFGMLLCQLPLHLKLYDGDGLVHLDVQFSFAGTACIGPFERETGAGVVPVHVQGKCGQRQQVNPIPLLQDIQVAVSCADTDHIGNTPLLPCRRAHPEHIVVSPLDVQGMVGHQLVHDDVGSRSPVVNIPQDMEMVHNQPLDQFTEGHDEFLCPPHPYDGGHNGAVIGFLVPHVHLFRNQFFNHICKFRRQGLADFGAGVLAGRPLAHLNQAVQGNLVPVLLVMYLL